jgi:hypothetical protein
MRTNATMPFVLGVSLLAGMFSTSDAQSIHPPKCANGLAPTCVRLVPYTGVDGWTRHICNQYRCPVAVVPRQPKVVEPKSTIPLGTAPKTTTPKLK